MRNSYLHQAMNYLAHAYLSFNDPEILLGNMISDYVKGRKKFDYEPGILKGIMLHRAIDTFTDQHPVTKTAMKFFKPAYGLYAGAFVDVVYDHFLVLDETVPSREHPKQEPEGQGVTQPAPASDEQFAEPAPA